MSDVPAEIVIERPHSTNGWKWCWAVCQPDATWGVWESGSSEDKQKAFTDAENALTRVWTRQEYENSIEYEEYCKHE